VARHEIPVNTTLGEETDLPLETKETLYRIAQEALHNTVKHARASRADLKLVCDARGIALEDSDDGAGFDPGEDFSGHLGPNSMRGRERAWAGRSGSTALPERVPTSACESHRARNALEGRRRPYQPADRARPVSISIRHTNLHPCSHFAAAAVGDPGVAAD
jgi:signal transduction histidine kinase